MMRQAKELSEMPHVVIATPGRLAHLLDNDNMDLRENLQNLQYLVLDECDRMLVDQSFVPDMRTIFKALPQERTNLFFSATKIEDLEQNYSKQSILGEDSQTSIATVDVTEDFTKSIQGLT